MCMAGGITDQIEARGNDEDTVGSIVALVNVLSILALAIISL